MNGEVVQKWLIAELNAATLTGVGFVYLADINTMPSKAGVYVALGGGTQVVRNISDEQEVRIVIVQSDLQTVFDNINELRDILNYAPGELKVWNIAPDVHSLRIHKIDSVTGTPPTSDGIGNTTSRAVLVFTITGRDTRRT